MIGHTRQTCPIAVSHYRAKGIHYGNWINANNEQAQITWSSESDLQRSLLVRDSGYIDPCMDMTLLLQQDTIIAKIEKGSTDIVGTSQGILTHSTPRALEI